MGYRRISKLKTPQQFRDHLAELGIDLPFDESIQTGADAPLARPIKHIGNRFCVLPMEGWDGTSDGKPTDLVRRRWKNFGLSGAKLIWGGEAIAVRHDGRATVSYTHLTLPTIYSV